MSTMHYLPFGRTGHTSSRIIFGAAALGAMSQSRADATLEMVTAAGINHIDTAAMYGDSEIRLHDFLQSHRDDVFLATKTRGRTGADARAELEQSLDRMGVDSVDLIQLHSLVEEDEWQTAFGADGAAEALFAARDDGLVAHVGVTGHGLRIPRMHLRSVAEAPFASVLFPWSHAMLDHPEYVADVDQLTAHCEANDIAMQTIKSVARRRWSDDDGHFSWYEPLTDGDALRRAVEFVLADPRVFLNTTSDARLLPAIIDAARDFDGRAPDAALLAQDRVEHGIVSLFDGGSLEGTR
ncbi:MAG: aldo/keto reductase [Actinomycetota bacterium]